MIDLPPEETELVRQGLRGTPGRRAALTSYEFAVDGRPFENRTESLFYGAESGGQARVLECAAHGSLPSRLKGKDVSVDLVFNGVPITRFAGRAHRPRNAGFASALTANTAGWWARGDNAVKLGRERFFAGYTPKQAAIEQLLRLPYRGPIDIEDPPQDEFERGNAEPFEKMEPVGSVLDAVADETRLRFLDTRLNGCRGTIEEAGPPGSFAGEPVFTFRVGRDCDHGDFAWDETAGEYYDVLAYRVRADGTTEDLAYAEIPDSSAPEGATYPILIETEGDEAYAEGAEKVNRAVAALVNGERPWTLDLKWIHPLLEEGDTVAVEEPADDGGTLVLRRWSCRVDLIEDEDPEGKTQRMSGLGVFREEAVEEPAFAVPRGSGGVVRAPFGLDYPGAYFGLPLPFVSYDDETGELVFDVEAAALYGVGLRNEGEGREMKTVITFG